MSLDQIRKAARGFQRGMMIRNGVEYAAGLVVVPAFSLMAYRAEETVIRIGAILVVLGALFALWQLHRRAGARRPPEASAAALMDFHRSELVRQRDAIGSAPLWYLLPFVPGMYTLLIGGLLNPQLHPGRDPEAHQFGMVGMIAVTTLVFVVGALIHRLSFYKLQKKIDELDALQRG